jgi:hypothetical protein
MINNTKTGARTGERAVSEVMGEFKYPNDEAFLKAAGIEGGLKLPPGEGPVSEIPAAAPKISALDKAEGRLNLGWNVPFAGFIGGGLYKLGRWLGVAGKPVKVLGGVMKAPHEVLETHNLADTTNAISSAVGYVGEKTDSQSLKNAAAHIAEKENAAGARVSGFVTQGLERVGEHLETRIKPGGWIQKFRDKRVQKAVSAQAEAIDLAQKTHVASLEQLGELEKSLHGKAEFAKARDVITSARQHLGEMPAATDMKSLAQRTKALNEYENALHNALKEVKQSVKSRKPVKAGVFAGAFTEPAQEVKAYKTELKAVKAAIKGVKKQFAGFSGSVAGVHSHLGNAEAKGFAASFSNLKTGLAGVPEYFSKMNGSEALNKGLYVGQQGFTGIRTVKGLGDSIGMFRQMNADAKGVKHKDVSLLKTGLQLAYLAKVPQELKEARGQFWKSAGPRVLFNLGSMVAFSKAMSRSAGMGTQMLGFALQGAAVKAGNTVASKNALLETYEAVLEAQKKGPVEKGAYLGLIVQAHMADKLNEGDPRLPIVAAQYEKENAPVAGVLKEFSSGAFAKRLAAVKLPEKAPEAKAAEPAAGAKDSPQNEPAGAALAKLTGKGALAPEQVVGDHTGKEAARRNIAAASTNLSPQPSS